MIQRWAILHLLVLSACYPFAVLPPEDNGVCGDGIVGAQEECDDGNNIDTDECPTTCLSATCGDGFIQSGVETCDPPDGAACDASCQLACEDAQDCQDQNVCTENERCEGNVCATDAVNQDDADACTADSCDPQTGVAHAPIDPDDGNECTTDACDPLLGVANTPVSDGTPCDADGNPDTSDVCLAGVCTASACGDGVIDVGEECDDGNTSNNDGCNAACQFEASLFVRCDGTTGGDGTLENPFRVLSEAITAASDNDIVMILPQSPQACGQAGTISRPLVLQGLANPLDPAAPAPPTIDGGNQSAVNVSLSNPGVVIVRDLILRADVNDGAINTTNKSQTALLRLDVQNSSIGGGSSAIDCDNGNNNGNEGVTLIDQSVIHDSPQGGLRVRNKSRVIVANSLFKSNGSNVGLGSARGAIEVENNETLVDILYTTFDQNHAGDNTCVGTPLANQAQLFSSITHNSNTNVFGAVDAFSIGAIPILVTFSDTFQEDGPPPDPSNINADPAFVTLGSGIAADYHLNTAGTPSPCIDAGGISTQITLSFNPLAIFGVNVFTHDFLGNPRPAVGGGAPDIGMFEEQ